MPEKKTLDAVIEAAFMAGVVHGMDAGDYEAEAQEAYRRWRDTWTGLPHEDHEEPARDRRSQYDYSHTEWDRLSLEERLAAKEFDEAQP